MLLLLLFHESVSHDEACARFRSRILDHHCMHPKSRMNRYACIACIPRHPRHIRPSALRSDVTYVRAKSSCEIFEQGRTGNWATCNSQGLLGGNFACNSQSLANVFAVYSPVVRAQLLTCEAVHPLWESRTCTARYLEPRTGCII